MKKNKKDYQCYFCDNYDLNGSFCIHDIIGLIYVCDFCQSYFEVKEFTHYEKSL